MLDVLVLLCHLQLQVGEVLLLYADLVTELTVLGTQLPPDLFDVLEFRLLVVGLQGCQLLVLAVL
jgi:hypothetical protein